MTKKILNVPILDVKIIYGRLDVMGTEYYIQQRLESGSVVDAYYGKAEKPTEIRNRNFCNYSEFFCYNRNTKKQILMEKDMFVITEENCTKCKLLKQMIGDKIISIQFIKASENMDLCRELGIKTIPALVNGDKIIFELEDIVAEIEKA